MTEPEERGDRIAKVLARAGLCSRREAERWIVEGRVKLDGVVLTTPAVTVPEGSLVLVDGKPLPEAPQSRLWRYHKPSGLVTTHKDEKGRETLFDRLPPELGRVISVGRLDLNSEGLILLTNDGALARRLELPSTGWVRRYKVRVHGIVDEKLLAPLERGLTIDGVRYGPIKADFERQKGANAWVTVALAEGKNREIRKVFEHLGVDVTRLIRLSYGPFQLGALERGQVEEVPRRVLRDQLGLGPARDKGQHAAPPQPAKPAEPVPRVRPPRPHHAGAPPRPTTPRPAGPKPSAPKRNADHRR
jgi:23S rRNA pseudouridine2605 synthase